jgi:transcriptional regulator with XRE-family HTH domain
MRKVRREANLTQAQFAERLGYSDKQVGQWEAGRNHPEDIVEVARRVHREFGVLPSWTLDVDSGPPPSGGLIDLVRREGIEPPTRWLVRSP